MSMKDAWDIPEFRRLLIGNGVNMLGTSIFIIGMSWTVAQIGGPRIYGLIFTAYFLGHLPSSCMEAWSSTGCHAER